MSTPRPARLTYVVWLLVAVPLGVWMVIGHSDVAAALFGLAAITYAATSHYLKRRPRPGR